MIHIRRTDEPGFWTEYCKKHPGVHYDELQKTKDGQDLRRAIRAYNISQQHGLCAYCCKSISLDDSLNEHIKPKGLGKYANLSMQYSNIIASCKTEGSNATCSAAKENHYDEKFVSPLDADCESHFDYFPNGEIVSDTPEGNYTIKVLNLNAYKLRKAREAQLQACENYHDAGMVKKYFLQPDENNQLPSYVDIVKCFYG